MYEDRIQRGITLLNERLPGWHNNVDTEILDIDDGFTCVLGQLYGDYTTGWYKLRRSPEEVMSMRGVDYGFTLGPVEGPELDELTRQWQVKIRALQEDVYIDIDGLEIEEEQDV